MMKRMPQVAWFTALLFIMFSAAVRSFRLTKPGTTVFSRSHGSQHYSNAGRVWRTMSTTGGEPDTSVVETCREKIQSALDALDVKVTGAC
jgi:hypothetical protein